jgi:hypothetical protein
MGKTTKKLIAALLSVILTTTVLVVSSYAWMIQSTSPEIDNIYIAVGGGNTILVAADMTVEENGMIYHFPGTFSNHLNFSQYESYDYLKQLGGMTPVSTADGINWYLPEYYGKNDPMVSLGVADGGQLKPVESFRLDDRLAHANLTAEQSEQIEKGSYIYLDFWVVSPGADYRLHISAGDGNNGTFGVGLPDAEGADTDGDGSQDSYVLAAGNNAAAASMRVGFLTNEYPVTDLSMFYYQRSEQFAARYTQLRGMYPEKYVSSPDTQYRFLIYEPNGTLHMGENADLQGSYVITEPLCKTEDGVGLANVADRLAVQDTNTWLQAQNSEQTRLQQAFQGATIQETFKEAELARVRDTFYHTYLQGQFAAYIDRADFFARTGNLYALAKNNVVSPETLEQQAQNSQLFARATEDVYIVDLEHNIPQRIRMFIWLEGQDVDCTNAASASGIAINFELAGSSKND